MRELSDHVEEEYLNLADVTHNAALISEHNFQCIDSPNRKVRCFLSGGAGGFREGSLKKSTDGFMHSWGGNDSGHFLIVTISGDQMKIEPIDWEGRPLRLFDVRGNPQPSSSIIVGP